MSLSRDNKKSSQEEKDEVHQRHATGLLAGEWSRPLCSWSRVGRLMGPKPVDSEDQTGFSPDDRNNLNFDIIT